MELTFTEIKKITNLLLKRTIDAVESRHDAESINQLLLKYKCQDLRELLQLMLCKMDSPELNMSMRESIKNITDESLQLHFELDFKTAQLNQSKQEVKYLKNEFNSLQDLITTYNEKSDYLQYYIGDLELILQHHQLSFKDEIKSIKPNSTPPKSPRP